MAIATLKHLLRSTTALVRGAILISLLATVAHPGENAYIDKTGAVVIRSKYGEVRPFYDGLAVVTTNGKSGYIDKTGSVVITPRFEYAASEFHDGLAQVTINRRGGYIDKSGNLVVEPQYDMTKPFSEERAVVSLRTASGFRSGYIDTTGKVIAAIKYEIADSFSEGLAAVELKGKWGFIDKSGAPATDMTYDLAGDFSDGLAMVVIAGKSGYIDKTGSLVIALKFDASSLRLSGDFKNGLACIKSNGKYGYIDRSGKSLVNPHYDDGRSFSEGRAVIKLDGKYGYIDTTGQVIVDPQYSFAEDFRNGFAQVARGYKCGYIDNTGKVSVDCAYYRQFETWAHTGRFSAEGLARVRVLDRFGYVDAAGKLALPLKYRHATDFHDGLAAVELTDRPLGSEIMDSKYWKFVKVLPGTFTMGSDRIESGRPSHTVTLTKGYEMGAYELVGVLYSRATNPDYWSDFTSEGRPKPETYVTWSDIQAFIEQLNTMGDGFSYRLPTEAEWEYAARAGVTGDYPKDLKTVAWYSDTAGVGVMITRTSRGSSVSVVGEAEAVGMKEPNGWGLYDILGNVAELCQDFFDSDYYRRSPSVDPVGPSAGDEHVIRGGSFMSPKEEANFAWRMGAPTGKGFTMIGFRLVREPRTP